MFTQFVFKSSVGTKISELVRFLPFLSNVLFLLNSTQGDQRKVAFSKYREGHKLEPPSSFHSAPIFIPRSAHTRSVFLIARPWNERLSIIDSIKSVIYYGKNCAKNPKKSPIFPPVRGEYWPKFQPNWLTNFKEITFNKLPFCGRSPPGAAIYSSVLLLS